MLLKTWVSQKGLMRRRRYALKDLGGNMAPGPDTFPNVSCDTPVLRSIYIGLVSHLYFISFSFNK
jgi:hypothetical protein